MLEHDVPQRFGVLGPKDDSRVPGELMVKLTPRVQDGLKRWIPTRPRFGVAGLPNQFGISELDGALKKYGDVLITRVHGPFSPRALNDAKVGDVANAMNATYRLRFADRRLKIDEAVKTLKALSSVADAAPNCYRVGEAIPNDPEFGAQWGLTKIECPAAWQKSTGHPELPIAIIDSGVDLNHPDLQKHIVAGADMVDVASMPPPLAGWHWEGDYEAFDLEPQDEVGHGTHVAGIVSAVTDNNRGVAGVTWHCGIMAVKVLARLVSDADPTQVMAFGHINDIVRGMRWAVDAGAAILNLSLGGYEPGFAEKDAVEYAAAHGRGLVAGSGNGDTTAPFYPAAYPEVVAVGAVQHNDRRVTKAMTSGNWGSNYGSWLDLVAPGMRILSTFWDDDYTHWGGTSMAAPFVTGVAALIVSCNPTLDANAVRKILRETATKLPAGTATWPNDEYGYGLVNARAAVAKACT